MALLTFALEKGIGTVVFFLFDRILALILSLGLLMFKHPWITLIVIVIFAIREGGND